MKYIETIAATTCFALILTSCSQNSVNGTTLKVQGTKMRTTGAFKTQLLMSGTRDRAGANNFVNHTQLKPKSELAGKVTTSMQVDQVKGLSGMLSVKGTPYATGDINSDTKTKRSGTFIIVAVNQKSDLLRELQKPENANLVKMLSRQNEPRIITAVATTVNHQDTTVSSLSSGASVGLEVVGVSTGNVGIQVKTTNESTYKFSDNTVFAYEMSIPAWQRDTSGKLYIVDYVEDRLGPRNAKPIHNTYLNPNETLPVAQNQIILAN